MKMSLGQVLAVKPCLEQRSSDIPRYCDPSLVDFPKREYRYRGVWPGSHVVTLDLRFWRQSGTLGCYFRTDDGRKFQLSGTYDLAMRAWGAQRAGVDFSSVEDVRLGDRFIVTIEPDGEPGRREHGMNFLWVDAVRVEDGAAPRLRAVPSLFDVTVVEGTVDHGAAPVEADLRRLEGAKFEASSRTGIARMPRPGTPPVDSSPSRRASGLGPDRTSQAATPLIVALGVTLASAASLVIRRLASARQ